MSRPSSNYDTFLWEQYRIVRLPAPSFPVPPIPFLPPPLVPLAPEPSFEAMRPRIFKRDRHTCRYCEDPAPEVDHIKPLSKGGSNWASNLVASCETCNDVAGPTDFGGFAPKRAAIRTARFGRP